MPRVPQRERLARLKRIERGLAAGRRLGADVQRLAAAVRKRALDQAVADLLRHPESAKWKSAAIVEFIAERQQQILGRRYAPSTLNRRVRSAIVRASASAIRFAA